MKKIFLLLILLPFTASAARVYIAPQALFHDGLLHVVIDTEGENINALSGRLSTNQGLIKEIYDGKSTLVIWIEKPTLVQESTINFSGITPGGFNGIREIFALNVKEGSTGTITFSEMSAFRNDGKGSPIKVTGEDYNVAAGSKSTVTADTESPEPFTLTITTLDDIYEGRKVLIFNAQDKGLGLDHYEIKSNWLSTSNEGEYGVTKSPHILTRADMFKKIYVKAVDKSGNTRIEVVSGEYRAYFFIILAIITGAICLILGKYTRRRSS